MLPGPLLPRRGSYTQTGRRLAAWPGWGLVTVAHQVSKNIVQGSFPTNYRDCWLGCIHSVPGHTLEGVGPSSPATGAWNEHHRVPNAPWEVFALVVSNSSFSQQPLEKLPLALHY